MVLSHIIFYLLLDGCISISISTSLSFDRWIDRYIDTFVGRRPPTCFGVVPRGPSKFRCGFRTCCVSCWAIASQKTAGATEGV